MIVNGMSEIFSNSIINITLFKKVQHYFILIILFKPFLSAKYGFLLFKVIHIEQQKTIKNEYVN